MRKQLIIYFIFRILLILFGSTENQYWISTDSKFKTLLQVCICVPRVPPWSQCTKNCGMN